MSRGIPETPPAVTGGRENPFAGLVDVSGALRQASPEARKRVFTALEFHEPDVADFAMRVGRLFGPFELWLDEATGRQVLAALEEVPA